jgi:hypothetical protein
LAIEIHQQAQDKSYKNLSEITISLSSINPGELHYSSLSICGLLSKTASSSIVFYKNLLTVFLQNVENIISNFEKNKILISKYIIFNEVFQNSPVLITEEKFVSNNTSKGTFDNNISP